MFCPHFSPRSYHLFFSFPEFSAIIFILRCLGLEVIFAKACGHSCRVFIFALENKHFLTLNQDVPPLIFLWVFFSSGFLPNWPKHIWNRMIFELIEDFPPRLDRFVMDQFNLFEGVGIMLPGLNADHSGGLPRRSVFTGRLETFILSQPASSQASSVLIHRRDEFLGKGRSSDALIFEVYWLIFSCPPDILIFFLGTSVISSSKGGHNGFSIMLIYFHHFAASVCGRCLLPLAMQVYTNPLPHCPVVAIRGRCLHEHQGGFRSLFSILHFTKGVLARGKGGWEGDGAIYYFFRQTRLQTYRFAIRPRWQKFKVYSSTFFD